MSRRRFYATPEEIAGSRIHLSIEESHHLLRVLRLQIGEEVYVFDGCGQEYRCAIVAAEGKCARLEILDALSDTIESPLRLTLAQALAKGEKFDFIVQKATELGVSAIAPLVTDYTDVKLQAESAAKRLERWRRISLEALKQCGRRRAVEISEPQTLRQFLAAPPPGAMLVFSEKGGVGITKALAEITDTSSITAV
ncbi:MAG TPA: RsmE family RNA methyltransferase, partial [Blastocatellia bacterium]|nr:RsmE family RNA methyltransferase [Blastocatellia bacterium]